MSAPIVTSYVRSDLPFTSASNFEYSIQESAADRERRRKALLQEARAWRRYAEVTGSAVVQSHRDFLKVGVAMNRYTRSLPPWIYAAMRDRAEAHAGGDYAPIRCLSYDECVLFQLFMALECEDEASLLPTRKDRRGK